MIHKYYIVYRLEYTNGTVSIHNKEFSIDDPIQGMNDIVYVEKAIIKKHDNIKIKNCIIIFYKSF